MLIRETIVGSYSGCLYSQGECLYIHVCWNFRWGNISQKREKSCFTNYLRFNFRDVHLRSTRELAKYAEIYPLLKFNVYGILILRYRALFGKHYQHACHPAAVCLSACRQNPYISAWISLIPRLFTCAFLLVLDRPESARKALSDRSEYQYTVKKSLSVTLESLCIQLVVTKAPVGVLLILF